mmetsp:Transcript_8091/g.8799  ORF Transcript_8091/g.8799 Transcript_8091/m.8799 type:complete len:510 (-) Transcript_8091:231-1760(-)
MAGFIKLKRSRTLPRNAANDTHLPYSHTMVNNRVITTRTTDSGENKALYEEFDYDAQKCEDDSDSESHGGPNVQAIAKAFDKFRYSEFCVLLYSTIGLVSGIIGSEIEYERFFRNNDSDIPDVELWTKYLLTISSVTTLLLVLALYQRYAALYNVMVVRHEQTHVQTFFSSGLLKNFLLEVFFCFPHPSVLLYGAETSIDDGSGTVTTYNWNSLLITGTINFRLYLYCRIFVIYSQYSAGRAQRITNMYGLDANYVFTIRCLMKKKPLAVLGWSFMVSGILGGYCFRTLERPDQESFHSIWNATWCSVITMTTVGYGDVVPKSFFGRIMGIVLSLWGVAVVSLMVIFISAGLEFNTGERKSYQTMEKLELKGKLRKSAALVIEHAFIRQRVRKVFTHHSTHYVEADITYKRKLQTFKNMVKRIRTTFQVKNLELHYLENDVSDLTKRIEKIEDQFNQFDFKQAQMDRKLDHIMKMMMRMSSNIAPSNGIIDIPNGDSSVTSLSHNYDER